MKEALVFFLVVLKKYLCFRTRPQDAFTDYIRKVASLSEHMLVVQQAHALLR